MYMAHGITHAYTTCSCFWSDQMIPFMCVYIVHVQVYLDVQPTLAELSGVVVHVVVRPHAKENSWGCMHIWSVVAVQLFNLFYMYSGVLCFSAHLENKKQKPTLRSCS